MREIKFRAWHNGGKYPEEACMLYVGDIHGTRHPLDCCKFAMDGQPVTLMQFTGLHDKNGVEIYEGDILADGDFVAEVVWRQEVAGFSTKTPRAAHVTMVSGIAKRLEVVGNMYENPELLETGS